MKALITGASTGIGKDMATYLGLLGFDLVLVARDEKKLQELKEQIDTNVEIIPMDLSLAENCLELYRKVGKVDVLINNAGFGIFGEFTKTSLIDEINLINLNILAVHTLTKLFIQDMEEQNFRIYNECIFNSRICSRTTYVIILCIKSICFKFNI